MANEYCERSESISKPLGPASEGNNTIVGTTEKKQSGLKSLGYNWLNRGQIETDSLVEESSSDTCVKQTKCHISNQAEYSNIANNCPTEDNSLVEDPYSDTGLKETVQQQPEASNSQHSEQRSGNQSTSDYANTEASFPEIESTSQRRAENITLSVQAHSNSTWNTDQINELKEDIIKSTTEIIHAFQTQIKNDISGINMKLESIMCKESSPKDCNDVVYNRIFYIISKHVALEPQKWKKLYKVRITLYYLYFICFVFNYEYFSNLLRYFKIHISPGFASLLSANK